METGVATTAANPSPSSSSRYVKTVVLRDWWLVRSQTEFKGKSLAVSGLPDEELAVRIFISAPVVKRHSIVTLETADGVYVILKGFINRPRTEDGGFTSEVFKYFLFGFPLDWEQYAGRKLGDDECPCPMSSPGKTTVNGCASTVRTTETFENSHAGDATDVVKAAPTPNKSKSVSYFAKGNESNVGATSGLKDMKTKLKTSENGTAGEAIDVVKAAPAAQKFKSVNNSTKGNVGATSGVKDMKTKLKTSKNISAGEAIDVVQAIPTTKKSKRVSDFTKNNAGATSGVKDMKTELTFDAEASTSVQESLKSSSVTPSEVSSLKKSRSGRLLLHPLEFWRNEKAVYDRSRQITGIVGGTPDSGKVVLASGTIRNKKRKHEGRGV